MRHSERAHAPQPARPCAGAPGPTYHSQGHSCTPQGSTGVAAKNPHAAVKTQHGKIKIMKSKCDTLGTECECAWKTPPAVSGNKGCCSHCFPAAWTVSPEGPQGGDKGATHRQAHLVGIKLRPLLHGTPEETWVRKQDAGRRGLRCTSKEACR